MGRRQQIPTWNSAPVMNRYSSRRSHSARIDQRRTNRNFEGAVIAILLIALIASLVVGIPSINYRTEARSYFVNRMLTECDSAVQRVQKLSRTAGSTSAQIMAEIRSYIYAVDVLNQAYSGTGGGQLLDAGLLNSMYSLLETYSNQLVTGTDTGEIQSAISDAILEIHNQIEKLAN